MVKVFLVLAALLLIAPTARSSELTEILEEFVKASTQIKQGLIEVKEGQTELRQGLVASYQAWRRSMALLIDLESTSNALKVDLEQAKKESETRSAVIIIGGSVLVAATATAIIIAIVK